MNIRKFITISAAAALLSGTAIAQTGSAVLDGIASELAAEGYTKIEMKRSFNRIQVRASGNNGETTRTYNRNGQEIPDDSGDDSADGYDDHGDDHGMDDHDGGEHDGNDDHDGGDDDGNDDHGGDGHGGDHGEGHDDGHDDGGDDHGGDDDYDDD